MNIVERTVAQDTQVGDFLTWLDDTCPAISCPESESLGISLRAAKTGQPTGILLNEIDAFMECDGCRVRPGSPLLCAGCAHNRELIAKFSRALKDVAIAAKSAAALMGSPLLQCIDCKNTESPAGAMARMFNRGLCLHCGGYFKVVRA